MTPRRQTSAPVSPDLVFDQAKYRFGCCSLQTKVRREVTPPSVALGLTERRNQAGVESEKRLTKIFAWSTVPPVTVLLPHLLVVESWRSVRSAEIVALYRLVPRNIVSSPKPTVSPSLLVAAVLSCRMLSNFFIIVFVSNNPRIGSSAKS